MLTRTTLAASAVVILLLSAGAGAQVAAAPIPGAAPAPMADYSGQKVVRVRVQSGAELDRVVALTDDVWSHEIGFPGEIDIRVTPAQLIELNTSAFPYTIVINDVQAAVDAQFTDIAQRRLLRDLSWFQNYKTYDEFNTYMTMLAATYPGMVTTFTAGQSLEGRAINGIRVTGPGSPSNRPAFLVDGCQHAREWVSPMTTLYVAEGLLSQYATDPHIHALVDSVEFIIIPIVNPDGYVFTWTPNNRLWRKNRRNNGDGTFGVDLNRNWGYQWGGEGASTATNNETYRGAAAFSEPETQVVRDFVLANPRIAANIDFHSYSELVLSPWGYTSALPPDQPIFGPLDASMASAIQSVNGLHYTAGPTYTTIYPASGVITDWSYGQQHLLAWGIELRDTGSYGFVLPAAQIVPTAQENFAAVLVVADYIAQPLRFTPSPAPTRLTPNTPTPVSITVASGSGAVDPSSVQLFTRVGATGSFTASPMSNGGSGSTYQGNIPGAPCRATVQYYFQAATTTGGTATYPIAGATEPLSAAALSAVLTFDDTCETNSGWTVGAPGDSATTGIWGLMAPQATPAQPGADHTPAPGVNCWVTDGRAGTSVGQYDVDGGATTLTSPLFSALSTQLNGDAYVSYWRWYSNDQGSQPNTNSMPVSISNDGGATWAQLELAADNANVWTFHSFRIADFLTPTATMRLRFVARDLTGAVVEAAVDDVQLAVTGCPFSPADFNHDGVVNVQDFLAFLAAYAAGDTRCDFNTDGQINVQDFLAFLSAYAAG
jgi:murein tripeptide amidase MpaA